ncbi:MAG: hypothetical protein H6672_03850 [Anaerolineaceae bacterium]|nr:hypothetical protein [Anaerolineaceae bacterium]
MAQESIPLQEIHLTEETVDPREQRLGRAAAVLRWGAIANGVIVGLILVLALLGGSGAFSNLFPTLHQLLLGRTTGADDAAVAGVALLVQLNISALLVLMVGVVAREIWGMIGAWLLVLVNLAGVLALGFTPGLVTIVASFWAGLVVGRDLRAFRLNPVMLKELRGRMRGARAFVVLTVYLGLMSGFTALLYLAYTPASRATGSAAAGEVGRVLFMGIVGIELMLIIFIAPAFTAGAITGERERQTYDLLQTTLLSGPSFVIGKLESALAYVLLLLFAAIPLQSIAFLFGGVTELEIIISFVILTVTGIALGTVGIFFSAVANRTLAASVRTYTTTLVATFAAPLVITIVVNILTGGFRTASPVIEALLTYIDDLMVSLNPIATALTTQSLLINQQEVGFWAHTLASDGSTIPRISPWISFSIIYLVVAAVLVVLAIRRMHRIEE